MSHQTIASLWEEHSREGWPRFSSPNEGQLMTLEKRGQMEIDSQRIAILQDCVADLDTLLDDLTEDSLGYFQRLRRLAAALVQLNQAT